MNLQLHEILIIGSCSEQVKFSEMTMDMYRMLQTLEREPTEEYQHGMFDNSPRGRGFPTISGVPSVKGTYVIANTNAILSENKNSLAPVLNVLKRFWV